MQLGKMILGGCLIAGAFGMAVGLAQDLQGHPNLIAARKYGQEAFDALTRAQQANHYKLGGHAERAKELYQEANHELDLAVQDVGQK